MSDTGDYSLPKVNLDDVDKVIESILYGSIFVRTAAQAAMLHHNPEIRELRNRVIAMFEDSDITTEELVDKVIIATHQLLREADTRQAGESLEEN